MVSGDVADCKNLEKLANVVSIMHASLFGVVEGIENVGGFTLGELPGH